MLTRVKEAGHGQEHLQPLAHHQLNLARLPAQAGALGLADKSDLQRCVRVEECRVRWREGQVEGTRGGLRTS